MIVAVGIFVGYFVVVIWGGRHHAATHSYRWARTGWRRLLGMRLLARSWAALIVGYVVVLYLATIIAAMAEAQVNALSFVGALLFVVVGIPVVDSLIGLAHVSAEPRAAGETSSWHGWLRSSARRPFGRLRCRGPDRVEFSRRKPGRLRQPIRSAAGSRGWSSMSA